MLRTMDPTPFLAMAAEPDVRAWLGFNDPSDEEVVTQSISGLVTNPQNFCFLTKERDGGYIVVRVSPGLYIAHTLSLPAARGRPMLKAMRDGFAALFLSSDAVEVCTMVPDGNEAASRWAEVAGFRPTYRREDFFPHPTDGMVGAQFMSLRYEDWLLKDPMCLQVGQLTHSRLDSALLEPSHPEDQVHDRWVGATMGACIEGNLEKAISFYNRYAVVAGYQPAKILAAHPPMVDLGNAVVQLLSGAMDILQVRRSGQV